MKPSGHLNPSEETGTGCPVTSKYERTPLNKHGGVGQQHRGPPSDSSQREGLLVKMVNTGHLVSPRSPSSEPHYVLSVSS